VYGDGLIEEGSSGYVENTYLHKDRPNRMIWLRKQSVMGDYPVNNKQKWLVEFRGGVGYTYDEYGEALNTACDAVLERAALEKSNDEARAVLDLIAQGRPAEALSQWNQDFPDPILLRVVEVGDTTDRGESLKERAAAALALPEPLPRMGLGVAIRHAEHQAAVNRDPQCAQDNAQLVEWLTDLRDMHKAIREWYTYADEGRSHNEALIETFVEVKGDYNAG